jgi:hypothetical protein
MKTRFRSIVIAALALGGLLSVAWSETEDLPKHSLSEWKLGDIVLGDQVKLDALEGKVVALEYWGVN